MQIVSKDITTVKEKAILVNGVNCQKRMGAGVAKAYYTKWPKVKEKYLQVEARLGGVNLIPVDSHNRLYVANCYTQEFYGFDGKRYASLEAITKCFNSLAKFSANTAYQIYTPLVGCGLGGLDWENEVKPALEEIEDLYDIEIIVCTL